MNTTQVDQRAREINSENTVRQKGLRTRASIISYFDGDDIDATIHSNASTYAAFIAVLQDSGRAGFERRRGRNVQSLRDELADAFQELGFVNDAGELAIPGRDGYNEIRSSIGPLMPAVLAILELEHGIDSTTAVRRYRLDSTDTIEPDEESEAVRDVSKDWRAALEEAPGCDLEAEAYIYALEVERIADSSTWYYVGKSEGQFSGLVSRVRSHAKDFNQSRVISHKDQPVLVGDYNFSVDPPGTTHLVVDIERIVSIHSDDLSALDSEEMESCYITELERKTAYEVALAHDTTNVLGGK